MVLVSKPVFDVEVFERGIPVRYKRKGEQNWRYGLVLGAAEYEIEVAIVLTYGGTDTATFSIEEVRSGRYEIEPALGEDALGRALEEVKESE